MNDVVIEVSAVRRSFRVGRNDRVLALDLPALEVRRGEGIVITGDNGSGKTTLVHLIAGILRPDDGRVVVQGQDLGMLSEADLDAFRARNVGCLLQGAPLLDFMTVEENVLAARSFFPGAHRNADSVASVLDRIGLGHRTRHLPEALSGGERQRLALAVAFANDPPILLADEPMSGLDPDGREQVRDILAHARSAEGKTIVVVSHHRDELPGDFRSVFLKRGSCPLSEAASTEEVCL
jgi:putative ABC transport system ATP-binding protein